MVQRLLRLFSAPIFEGDEEKTRAAGLLNVLALSTLVGSLVYLPFAVMGRLPYVVLAIALILAVWLVMKRGHVRFASIAMVAGFAAFFAVVIFTGGGVRSPAFGGLVVVTLFGGLLLGAKGAVGMTIFGILYGAILLQIDALGLLPAPAEYSGPSSWIIESVFFALVGVMLTFSLRLVNDARVRHSRELGERRRVETERGSLLNLLEASLNEIYVFDSETLKFQYVNRGALRNLGYSPEQLMAMTPVDLKPEFTESSFREMIAPMLRGDQEKHIFRTVHRRADGNLYPVEVHLQLVENAGSRVFLAVILDITERRQAEEKLLESETKYRLLVEQAPDGIFISDLSGKYSEVNTRGCALLGFTRQELLAMKVTDLIPPEDLTSDPLRLEGLRLGGALIKERRLIRKDGSLLPVEVSARLLPDGRLQEIVRDITERKEAEERLRYNATLLRHVLNTGPAVIFVKDRESTILLANEKMASFYNLRVDEVLGRRQSDLHREYGARPEDVEKWLADDREVIDSGQIKHVLETGVNSSRQLRWFETVKYPFDIGPAQRGVLVFSEDITERKQAEQALENRGKYLSALIENNADAIAVIDASGKVLYQSPSSLRILGVRPGVLADQGVFAFVHPEDQAEALSLFAQLTENPGKPVVGQLRYRHGDGSWRWVEAVGTNLLDEPVVQGIVVNFRDITDRKHSEIEIDRLLDELRRRLRQVEALNSIELAISASMDLRIILSVLLKHVESLLQADAAAVLLFNPDLRQFKFSAGRGFRTDAFAHAEFVAEASFAGQVVLERKRVLISHKLSARASPRFSKIYENEGFLTYAGIPLIAKGQIKGVLEVYCRTARAQEREWLNLLDTLANQAAIAIENAGLLENLQRSNAELERRVIERTAELHRSNAELERANRAKDEFLANMSHELRTPLNSILGLSESLLEQKRGALNEHQMSSLQMIGSSGRHLLELINDILDLSKIEAGKFGFFPQPVVIDEVCKSSLFFVKSQAARKSIALTYDNQSSVATVSAEPRRIKQILINLLNNAVKFTPDNGKVTLEVRADPEEDVIQFSVIDTGIGIADDDLQRLFIPFVQLDGQLNRQFEGTGLGLVLVQRLTDLHGGSVQVESEVGKGSRFTINLHARRKLPEQVENVQTHHFVPTAQGGSTEPARHLRILLAEDNAANILMIGERLVSHGYEMLVAYDGIQAIEKARETRPDIILMDLQMPVMDGLEATRRLRTDPRFDSTPIVALTALAMPGDRQRCLVAGANEYMTKPVGLKKLIQVIEKLSKPGRS